jgi:AcrR family transcriptional regulator
MTTTEPSPSGTRTAQPGARQRIVDAASELFYREGIRAVGVDTIVARAGVAKMTLYRHFPSKDHLVTEVLRMRDREWREWLSGVIERRGGGPADRLDSVFAALEEWYSSDEFRGSAFINARVEIPDPDHPASQAAAEHVALVRAVLARLASEAGVDAADELAARLQMVIKGATVMALEGDHDAGPRARRVAAALMADAGITRAE